MIRVGLDIGYGYTKVYPRKERFKSSVYPYSSRLGLKEKKGIVVVDGEAFEVGKARSVELRTKSFHSSPEWKALLLYALRDASVPVKLVLGLPVSLATREVREKIESSLKGEHTAVIDGRKRSIVVSEAKVFPQGLGVLYDYFIENGRLIEDRTRENITVIDIGFYTTDVFVYRHGEILEDRCSSYEIGVGWLLEQIREELKSKYSYPSVSLKEVEEFWTRGFAPYEGQKIAIDRERFLGEFKSRLVRELRAHEEDLKLADTILWAGGGAYLIADHRVKPVPEPELANARGFYKYSSIVFGG